jgi:hypothetical protein
MVSAAVLVLGLPAAVSAVLFQPWKLWVDEVVNEPPPGRTRVLAEGEFVSHEHTTSGTARLLRLPDGALVVRIEDLTTSNGPQLRVWLTDAPVIGDRRGWFVFDDRRYVDLGRLKGNIGDQNYPVDATANLDGLHSLTIWCARFHVSFGAADLGSPVSSDA